MDCYGSVESLFFVFKFNWLCWVLVAAFGLLVEVYGVYFLDQGSNLVPLHWELRVLTTGPPGKSRITGS